MSGILHYSTAEHIRFNNVKNIDRVVNNFICWKQSWDVEGLVTRIPEHRISEYITEKRSNFLKPLKCDGPVTFILYFSVAERYKSSGIHPIGIYGVSGKAPCISATN